MNIDVTNPQVVAEAASWVMKSHKYVVIATADIDGTPWAVPVNRAYDLDGNITWMSRTDARHSQYLARNPRASAVLYSSDPVQGDAALYLEGPVAVVTDETELDLAVKMRFEQAGKPVPPITNFLGSAPDRLYRLSPTAAWITEARHGKTPVDLKLFEAALSTRQ